MCGRGFLGGGSSLWIRVSPQRMRNTPPHHKTSWHSPYNTKPRKAELRMFEKVTVTDAMAEDMDKLRPRLKNVHIRELVVAIIIMPKTQKPTFTCRRKGHCSHGQPWTSLTSSHPYSHPGSRYLLGSQATTAWGS